MLIANHSNSKQEKESSIWIPTVTVKTVQYLDPHGGKYHFRSRSFLVPVFYRLGFTNRTISGQVVHQQVVQGIPEQQLPGIQTVEPFW